MFTPILSVQARRPLVAGAALVSLASLASLAMAAGCGPRVFDSAEARVVEPGMPIEVAAPPVAEPVVEVTDDKIIIHEQVQFAYNSAKIARSSHGLLDAVAQAILDSDRIVRVRVDGYTSAEGSESHNLDLSQRRAEAVVTYLVKTAKVPAERLESSGYGAAEPIASNDDEVGREQNRRVEFMIVEQRFTQTRTITDPSTGLTKVETEELVE